MSAAPGTPSLIRKWLKAGVIEAGAWQATERGTPQGAVISPLLANIYLHYAYDLWVRQWRHRHAQGAMIVVRYADDTVVGFEHRPDAERFLAGLRERMADFGLELHPEKTRLIEFGRCAVRDRAARGENKPETFDDQHARPGGLPPPCMSSNLWRRALRRRSQRDRTTWLDTGRLAERYLPRVRITHPWPFQRFAVKHPRWEPYAGMPHVRFCAGGAR